MVLSVQLPKTYPRPDKTKLHGNSISTVNSQLIQFSFNKSGYNPLVTKQTISLSLTDRGVWEDSSPLQCGCLGTAGTRPACTPQTPACTLRICCVKTNTPLERQTQTEGSHIDWQWIEPWDQARVNCRSFFLFMESFGGSVKFLLAACLTYFTFNTLCSNATCLFTAHAAWFMFLFTLFTRLHCMWQCD